MKFKKGQDISIKNYSNGFENSNLSSIMDFILYHDQPSDYSSGDLPSSGQFLQNCADFPPENSYPLRFVRDFFEIRVFQGK